MGAAEGGRELWVESRILFCRDDDLCLVARRTGDSARDRKRGGKVRDRCFDEDAEVARSAPHHVDG